MARMEAFDGSLRDALEGVACPTFEDPAWVSGPPLGERRVAILSTAALQERDGPAWNLGDADYRVIPGDTDGGDLVMSHYSVNFDRVGFQQDVNVVFPIDRLRELAAEGEIGSVADFHYSFMGSTDPALMGPSVKQLAPHLHDDGVDALLLAPV